MSILQLLKDNQELRDVCCYLDDTRQKSKRLAHEWQSFGRYTASVLKSEVVEFETKISILQVSWKIQHELLSLM